MEQPTKSDWKQHLCFLRPPSLDGRPAWPDPSRAAPRNRKMKPSLTFESVLLGFPFFGYKAAVAFFPAALARRTTWAKAVVEGATLSGRVCVGQGCGGGSMPRRSP